MEEGHYRKSTEQLERLPKTASHPFIHGVLPVGAVCTGLLYISLLSLEGRIQMRSILMQYPCRIQVKTKTSGAPLPDRGLRSSSSTLYEAVPAFYFFELYG